MERDRGYGEKPCILVYFLLGLELYSTFILMQVATHQESKTVPRVHKREEVGQLTNMLASADMAILSLESENKLQCICRLINK